MARRVDVSGTPGASAQAEYERRRRRDLERARIAVPVALVTAALTGVAVQMAVGRLAAAVAVAAGTALVLLVRVLRVRPTTAAWARGAEGERRMARLLAPLERDGFVTLHDLRVPGSRANVDHLVIGPSGVWVVDPKAYTGRITRSGRGVWTGRHRVRTETTAWEAARVADVLARQLGERVEVRPVLAVLGARCRRRGYEWKGVRVLPARRAVALVARRRSRGALSPAEVERVALAARQALAPARPALASPRGADAAQRG